MRVRDLLDVPGLKLRLLTDVTGLDRQIKHVYTTDLPDPGRYLTPGDLVLTGMIWCREPGDADRFVRALVKAGAGVLGAGEALGDVPPEIIEACGRHGVALLAVPAETSFAAVTDEVARRLSGDRATAMTRVLGRRRLLLSAVAEGAGLDEMFRLMGRETGVDCWLLTATGRVVGGTGPAPSRQLALRLAAEYLKADRLPAAVKEGEERYSLFGVGAEPRLASWFLVCLGLDQDWPHELRESVLELAADVALERARLEAGRAGDRKLAEAIIALLADEGSAPAEVASLLRAADLTPDGTYLVAALRVAAESGRVGFPAAADRWRYDLAEELAQPERVLAAMLGEELILLIPVVPAVPGVPVASVGAEPALGAHVLAGRLREVCPVVEADRTRPRLSVGVAAPATGVSALAGAVHEASSARRLAALHSAGAAGMTVVTSDEVASHELLLASIPGSVLRSFRDRLLGPLLAYDAQHRAELLPTLREFLDCSGSWNACAAKMYVHVNTVRYRIKRIEELTGRDLSSLDDRVDFFLALRIRLPARSACRCRRCREPCVRYVEGIMVRIRAAVPADAAAVAAVRRASWFAAYSGIIDDTILDQATGPADGERIRQTFRARPQQRMIVADIEGVIGYASYGPERDVLGAPWPPPVSAAGAAGDIAELYALYVHPDWWSTGTGRALLERVLSWFQRDRYRVATLWVLEQNARARRFYERAGFAPDGAVNVLDGLGGVHEVRYRCELASTGPASGPARSTD